MTLFKNPFSDFMLTAKIRDLLVRINKSETAIKELKAYAEETLDYLYKLEKEYESLKGLNNKTPEQEYRFSQLKVTIDYLNRELKQLNLDTVLMSTTQELNKLKKKYNQIKKDLSKFQQEKIEKEFDAFMGPNAMPLNDRSLSHKSSK